MDEQSGLITLQITALVGCAEPTYEERVRDAVEDSRSQYGIQVLTDLCDQAEQKKLKKSDLLCFAALTRKYGEPAVQIYRDLFSSYQAGQCEFNADLSHEVSEANMPSALELGVVDDAAAGADDDAASSELLDRLFYESTGLERK